MKMITPLTVHARRLSPLNSLLIILYLYSNLAVKFLPHSRLTFVVELPVNGIEEDHKKGSQKPRIVHVVECVRFIDY